MDTDTLYSLKTMSSAASVFCCCKYCRQPADLKCTACSVVRYCCKDHQTRDWQAHKPLCKWLREELLKRPLKADIPALIYDYNSLDLLDCCWTF